MVNKNYIILVHENPDQLFRLVKKLDDGFSSFYIHVDKKSDLTPFGHIQHDNVKFIEKRVDCIWGDFSLVLATFNCIKEIINDNKEGYTILLSGQDYPIKGNSAIDQYLLKNSAYEHISMHISPLPKTDTNFYINRLINIKINLSSKRGAFVTLPYFWSLKFRNKISYLSYIVKKGVFKKGVLKIFWKRKMPFAEFSHGHQWWAFQFNTLKKVYYYIEKNKKHLFGFYKYVLIGDESFFHSIIKELMKTDPSIKLKNCLTYIDWNHRDGRTLPITFNIADLDLLLCQPEHKLFARKFDPSFDESILDALDNNT